MAAPEPLLVSYEQFGTIAAQQQWFWRVLEQTIERVFDEEDAASIVDDYRRQIDRESSGLEQIALYHSSPLSVAADLMDWTHDISEEKLQTFLKIQIEAAEEFGVPLGSSDLSPPNPAK